jgi:hypothetical protein
MPKIDRRAAISTLAAGAFSSLAFARELGAESPDAPPSAALAAEVHVVEYLYKCRWGAFDEFMTLYVKNHYPILERYKQLGRIVSMSATFPINHAAEPARWDMRFTIVYKDAATAYEDTSTLAASITKELYPDKAAFDKEEQRRFELLLEHTDVPVFVDDLASW